MEEALVKVFRFEPGKDVIPKYEEYRVPIIEGATVLWALRHIYENLDGSLAFRDYFCKTNSCGLCAMLVNGKPRFACHTKLEKEVTVEPLPGYPVIRDLVVDLGKTRFFPPDEQLIVRSGTTIRRLRNPAPSLKP